MNQSASTLQSSARSFSSSSSSTADRARSSAGKTTRATRRYGAFISTVLPGLDLMWDLSLLDRLQAPLTHYHE